MWISWCKMLRCILFDLSRSNVCFMVSDRSRHRRCVQNCRGRTDLWRKDYTWAGSSSWYQHQNHSLPGSWWLEIGMILHTYLNIPHSADLLKLYVNTVFQVFQVYLIAVSKLPILFANSKFHLSWAMSGFSRFSWTMPTLPRNWSKWCRGHFVYSVVSTCQSFAHTGEREREIL